MMDEQYFDTDEDSFLLRRLRDCPEIFARISASTSAELSNQRRLRDEYDEELVRAALSVHDARQRAANLLPHADQLWLTRVEIGRASCRERV